VRASSSIVLPAGSISSSLRQIYLPPSGTSAGMILSTTNSVALSIVNSYEVPVLVGHSHFSVQDERIRAKAAMPHRKENIFSFTMTPWLEINSPLHFAEVVVIIKYDFQVFQIYFRVMGLMDLQVFVPLYFHFAFCSLVPLSLHRIDLADNVFVPLISITFTSRAPFFSSF